VKNTLIVGLALATALVTAPVAKASTTIAFNSNDGYLAGSGLVTGSSIGGGSYIMNSGSLSISLFGSSYSAVVIPNAYPYTSEYPYDNQVTAWDNIITPTVGLVNGSPYMDSLGLLFQVNNADSDLLTFWVDAGVDYWGLVDPNSHQFFDAAGNFWDLLQNYSADGSPENAFSSFSITGVTDPTPPPPTPEPSSMLLMGTGLLGMAGFLYRKAKASAVNAL
jgi:hypothetical protein